MKWITTHVYTSQNTVSHGQPYSKHIDNTTVIHDNTSTQKHNRTLFLTRNTIIRSILVNASTIWSHISYTINIKNRIKHITTHCNWLHYWHQLSISISISASRSTDTTTLQTPEIPRFPNHTKIVTSHTSDLLSYKTYKSTN